VYKIAYIIRIPDTTIHRTIDTTRRSAELQDTHLKSLTELRHKPTAP